MKFLSFRDLKRNLCRNPDGDRAPWCYTTDPAVRWEYCNIEKCSPKPVGAPSPTPAQTGASFSFYTILVVVLLLDLSTVFGTVSDCKIGNGATYRGPTSITLVGVTCQAWSAQSPHQHNSFTPTSHPDKGLEGNVSIFRVLSCFYLYYAYLLTIMHHFLLFFHMKSIKIPFASRL